MSANDQPHESRGPIRRLYEVEATRRMTTLETARQVSSFIDPTLLPPTNHMPNQPWPAPNQSLGSRGNMTLAGKFHAVMLTPGDPFIEYPLPAWYRHDPSNTPEDIRANEAKLRARQLIAHHVLIHGNYKRNRRATRPAGAFYNAEAMALRLLDACGDILQFFDRDYRLHNFRLDQYTTRRDSSGQVLFHTIREAIDPKALGADEQEAIRKAGDGDILNKAMASDRLSYRYTHVEYQPEGRNWVITQETLGATTYTDEETVSPYISTPFFLSPSADYGTGLSQMLRGSLGSYDELTLKIREMAAVQASSRYGIDEGSSVTQDDYINTPPGGFIPNCRIENGKVVDIAPITMVDTQDIASIAVVMNDQRQLLESAYLMASGVGSVQGRDRVTATERAQIAAELNDALGGMYAPVVDNMLVPLAERLEAQCESDNLFPESIEVDADLVHPAVLTGLQQVTRERKKQSIIELVNASQFLGEEAQMAINPSGTLRELATLMGVDENRQIVRSQAEIDRMRRQRMAEEAGAQAGAQVAVDRLAQQSNQSLARQQGA